MEALLAEVNMRRRVPGAGIEIKTYFCVKWSGFETDPFHCSCWQSEDELEEVEALARYTTSTYYTVLRAGGCPCAQCLPRCPIERGGCQGQKGELELIENVDMPDKASGWASNSTPCMPATL